MNPQPDLHDQLSAIAEHGSRTLRPRPVDAVIGRGRQRTRRARVAAGAAAVAVVAIAVTTASLAREPRQRTDFPVAASPAPATVAPEPIGDLTGTSPVTLQLASGNSVVAGSDDDDRVLADTGQTKEYPDEDNAARGRWLIKPSGATFAISLAAARPAGRVCMAGATDGTLRIRLCASAAAQRFTLAPTADPGVFALSLGGAPVLVNAKDELTTRGTGTLAELRITPAK